MQVLSMSSSKYRGIHNNIWFVDYKGTQENLNTRREMLWKSNRVSQKRWDCKEDVTQGSKLNKYDDLMLDGLLND